MFKKHGTKFHPILFLHSHKVNSYSKVSTIVELCSCLIFVLSTIVGVVLEKCGVASRPFGAPIEWNKVQGLGRLCD